VPFNWSVPQASMIYIVVEVLLPIIHLGEVNWRD
jgi:hypothetical protein